MCNLLYSQESTHIKTKEYEGYIFHKEHLILMSVRNEKERYTPTVEDIEKAENLLITNMDLINCFSSYNFNVNKRILKKYKRQYVGFITKDNNIIIWINFIKNKNITHKELAEDILIFLDGGTNYWSIFINLTQEELFDIQINGIS